MVDKPIFTCQAKEAVFRFTVCMLLLLSLDTQADLNLCSDMKKKKIHVLSCVASIRSHLSLLPFK